MAVQSEVGYLCSRKHLPKSAVVLNPNKLVNVSKKSSKIDGFQFNLKILQQSLAQKIYAVPKVGTGP